MTRPLMMFALLATLWPGTARAQAPIVLGAPTSARATALGGAWVSARDQDVVFANPAEIIGARSDFAVTMTRLGPGENGGAFGAIYAGGKMSFTLGFGAQVINTADRQLSLAVIDAAVVYKGFRIGAAGKYAANGTAANPHTTLLDIGVGRNLFGGVAGLAVQNLGSATRSDSPNAQLKRQVALGWSKSDSAGPLDLALFTQLTARSGWASPAAGLEAGYSWIEGLSIALRAGVRRPELSSEKPVALGAAFTADRFTLEYAVRFFDNSRRAHVVTIRWR